MGVKESMERLRVYEDYRILAKEYLAEHPADDNKPITEEWLLLVGFIRHEALDQYAIGDGIRVVNWPSNKTGDWLIEIVMEMQEIPDPQTRGDVRRLCRALGIELRE